MRAVLTMLKYTEKSNQDQKVLDKKSCNQKGGKGHVAAKLFTCPTCDYFEMGKYCPERGGGQIKGPRSKMIDLCCSRLNWEQG